MKRFLCFLSLLVGASFAFGQEIYFNDGLAGYWTGALIRGGNSIQIIEAEFFEEADTFRVETSIPDWVYYGPKKSKVKKQGIVLEFDTYYGPAIMVLDTAYNEMIGSIQTKSTPGYEFHLKKSLKPFAPKVIKKDLSFQVEGVRLKGIMYTPAKNNESLPTAIFVGGRGCGNGNWLSYRGKLLAEYGMTCISIQERGDIDTGTDCLDMTHDQEVEDLATIIDQVSKFKEVDATRLGLITYSAGGWIGPAVTQLPNSEVDWIVTVVGPATSVKQQQLDGARYYSKQDNYSELGAEQVLAYTELLFQDRDTTELHAELEILLKDATKEKWINWLEETDIAATPSDIEKLWVRRYDFDPAEALRDFKGPFLSLLGEKDFVVPYAEQIEALQAAFGPVGKTNYRVVILPGAGHGMEHGPTFRNWIWVRPIQARPYYFKYDRVAHGAIAEILKFLEDFEILK
ncbi:MAG: alpha/beta hydrolase [Bacteroidota bacterium]